MERFPLPDGAKYAYARNFSAEHRGTDIMAPIGTPVLAVDAGKAWSDIDPKGGKVAYLETDDGVRYYYAHLSEWATRLIQRTQQSPLTVAAGDELGKVGTSGNAEGRPAHLHFQIRRGSLVSDPFLELLDVDPHKRGDRSNGAAALLVLALLLMMSRQGRIL